MPNFQGCGRKNKKDRGHSKSQKHKDHEHIKKQNKRDRGHSKAHDQKDHERNETNKTRTNEERK